MNFMYNFIKMKTTTNSMQAVDLVDYAYFMASRLPVMNQISM